MRRLIAVAFGIFVALSVAIPASAASNVDTIVGALQEAPVYVDDGAEGATSDTAATLLSKLYDDDNVVIVMLPADETLATEDVNALAQKISNDLKDERIVGIAVGSQFAGAASILPSGTANDLMKRAETVSTNSAETLITFIRNVHDWQKSNPDYMAAPEPAKAESAAPVWPFMIIGVSLVVTMSVLFLYTRRRIRGRVHYTAPGNLNDPVRSMMDNRKHLETERYWDNFSPTVNAARRDSVGRMSAAIDATCRYTEAYFKRFASEKKNSDTLTIFNNQLELAQKVVKDYVYTYENHEFIEDPIEVMKRGHDAIEGLAETILSSIKKGNNDRLMDYKVSTNILDAQRYKDPKSRR